MIRQLKISLLNKIIFFSIIFFPQELLAKPCGNPNNLIKGENTIFIATYDIKKNKVIFGTNTNKFHKIADDMYGFEIYDGSTLLLFQNCIKPAAQKNNTEFLWWVVGIGWVTGHYIVTAKLC